LSQSPTIAYLSSEYPALSHTFIEREITALRESGHPVCTASIRKPSVAHVQRMNEREHREIEQTLYIKHRLFPANAFSIVTELVKHPILSLMTLLASLSLSRRGFRSGCKALGYTLEALVLRRWLRQRHAKHLHVHFANPAATVALLAVKDLDCDLSISVHGPDIFDNVRDSNLVDKFRAAQRVRVISNYCKSQVCRWMKSDEWDKCHRIRCGISRRVRILGIWFRTYSVWGGWCLQKVSTYYWKPWLGSVIPGQPFVSRLLATVQIARAWSDGRPN
jgi:colanic acid/amylovoran biosynthesis glycosyltransferase